MYIAYDVPLHGDPIVVDIDSVIENTINLESWEVESGGFEVTLPLYRINSNNERVMLFSDGLDENSFEITSLLDVDMYNKKLYFDFNDYSKLNTYYSDGGRHLYIKSEKVSITEPALDSTTGLYYTEIGVWDSNWMTKRNTNYPRLGDNKYTFSNYPITYVGRTVALYDTIDTNKIVFMGEIAEEPTLEGNLISLSIKSKLDQLDSPILNDIEEEDQQQTLTFRTALRPDSDLEFSSKIRTEFALIPGLVLDDSLSYLDSEFKLGSFKTFKEIFTFFCQINQVFPYMSYSSHGPVVRLKGLRGINKQLIGNIESRTIASIKSVEENIKVEKYNGVSSVTVKTDNGSVIARNTLSTVTKLDYDMEVEIPKNIIFKNENRETSFIANEWINNLFATFGRIYQKITIPTLGSFASKYYTAGEIYNITDLGNYRTFTTKAVAESISNYAMCISITNDAVELLHIRDYFQYPISPSFMGKVHATASTRIEYYRGFTAPTYYDMNFTIMYPDYFVILKELEMTDSGIKYYKVGYRIRLRSVEDPSKVGDYTISFISSSSDFMQFTTSLYTTFDPEELVMVEYPNESELTAGSDQLKWLYLED